MVYTERGETAAVSSDTGDISAVKHTTTTTNNNNKDGECG